jgi:hypothetical protein
MMSKPPTPDDLDRILTIGVRFLLQLPESAAESMLFDMVQRRE